MSRDGFELMCIKKMFAHRLKGLAEIYWRRFEHGLNGYNGFIFGDCSQIERISKDSLEKV